MPARPREPTALAEPARTGQPLHFSPFWLDPGAGRLWRGREALPLKPKAFALLRYLAERPQRLLTKDVLLDALWHDTRVSEGVLKTHLKEIRHVLGDTARMPRFIETVHRRGYRFIAAVSASRSVSDGSAARQADAASFVGRSGELARLERTLELSLMGSRRIVFVAGAPGVGKTMLVNRLVEPLRQTRRASVAVGQCIATYGAGEAYLPILEALGRLCREAEGERIVDTLRRHAPTWLAQMPEFLDHETLVLLQQMLAGTGPERMLRELAMALPILTSHRPLVLVLEDLHWADHSTLVLLSYLIRRSEEVALFVVGTYRPQELASPDHALRALQAELRLQSRYEELALGALDRGAVAAYLESRYSGHAFPAALGDAIHARTEGHPLFMARLIDQLEERGVLTRVDGCWRLEGDPQAIARQVPSTVLAMIGGQIDGLAPEERAVLEAGSAMGLDFSCAAVAYAIERDVAYVETLCAAWASRGQFLVNEGTRAGSDDRVSLHFAFDHALYREVIYQHLLPARLSSLHQRIGVHEEAWHGDSPGTVAPALALHFERGQRPDRAIRYRQLAGRHALALNSYPEAIRHFSAALELLERLDDSPERRRSELELNVALGVPLTMTLGYSAARVERVYARAAELGRELGDAEQLGPALAGVCTFYVSRAAYDVAEELGKRGLERAEQSSLGLANCHFMVGLACFFQAKLGSAITHLERAVALAHDSPEPFSQTIFYRQDPGVAAGSVLSWALWQHGHTERSARASDEALLRARRSGQPFGIAFALQFKAILHQFRGEPELSRESAEALITLSREQGFAFFLGLGIMARGVAELQQGQYADAIESIRRGHDQYRVTGAQIGTTYYLMALGEAQLRLGRFDEACDALAAVTRCIEETSERAWEPELYGLHAELALACPERSRALAQPPCSEASAHDLAEAWLRSAVRVSRASGAIAVELRAALSLGRHWASQGRQSEAHELLRDVHARLP